jgi:hypothetical protein
MSCKGMLEALLTKGVKMTGEDDEKIGKVLELY